MRRPSIYDFAMGILSKLPEEERNRIIQEAREANKEVVIRMQHLAQVIADKREAEVRELFRRGE